MKVTSLDAPPLFSPHEAACWASGYNQAQAALGERLKTAEQILHQADEVIEILFGDREHETSRMMLDVIEQYFVTYPEPLE